MALSNTMPSTILLTIISALLVVACHSAPVENDAGGMDNPKNDVGNIEDTKIRQKRGDLGSHVMDDVIAQASCGAYIPIRPEGWVYAVRRECSDSAPTCAQVCANKYLHVQDPQTAQRTTWRCAGGIHVYGGRPATGDGKTPKLGLKTFFLGYESCGGGCGPNYCCCRVDY